MANLNATTKDKLEVSLPSRQASIAKDIFEWVLNRADEKDYAHKLADFLRENTGWFARFFLRFIPIEKAEDFLLDWLQELVEDGVDQGAEELQGILNRHGIAE